MDLVILQAIIFALLGTAGYLAWKKYRNKDYFWFSLISFSGLLLMLWDYVSANMLQLPLIVRTINSGLSFLIWTFFVAIVLKVAILGSKK